ncbi:MAG: NAD(P)/FAD-dependent oxidoreductase [Candidatus Cloacimonadota bacterium]|nr:NAD(P)/FAD-dependent oxidoreductase [Candidatus Cloacimonadota bacterium]
MKIKDSYDIVVVGSGPAGGMTARAAAQKGASVLILERDREIGIPVRCAEGISQRGLTRYFEPDPQWISCQIKGALLYAPNGAFCPMIADAIGDGYVLERRLFDAHICKEAAIFGADILTKADAYDLLKIDGKISGVKFRHFGVDKEVRCNIVIGADGPESRMGRLAGIGTALELNDLESAAQYLLTNIDYDSDYCHFYFGNEFAPGGYVWVFPKDENTANVGIGIQPDKANTKNAKEYLDEWISKNFSSGKELAFISGSVPTAQTLSQITADNFMLVGDAARQVNPVTGGGLSNILFAGNVAGEVAAEAVMKKDFSHKFLKKYQKLWNKEKGKSQKVFYKLKKVFFDFSDEELNKIVNIISDIPEEELTLFQLFKVAVRHHPKLIKDLVRIYL